MMNGFVFLRSSKVPWLKLRKKLLYRSRKHLPVHRHLHKLVGSGLHTPLAARRGRKLENSMEVPKTFRIELPYDEKILF